MDELSLYCNSAYNVFRTPNLAYITFDSASFTPGFNQQVGDIWTTQNGFGSSTSSGGGGDS